MSDDGSSAGDDAAPVSGEPDGRGVDADGAPAPGGQAPAERDGARRARGPSELRLDDVLGFGGGSVSSSGDPSPVDLAERRRRRLAAGGDPAADALAGIDEEVQARHRAGARNVQVSLAWFPQEEWDEARTRWPDLADYNPADHREYCHTMEGRAKLLARRLGQDPSISPIHVDELETFAAERLLPADSGEARSGLAAEVARTGRAVVWPPGRNDPCWCGSGAKYKACCADAPEVDH